MRDLLVGQPVSKLGEVPAVDGNLVAVVLAEQDDLERLAGLDPHGALVLLGAPAHGLDAVPGDEAFGETRRHVNGNVVPGIQARAQLVVDGETAGIGGHSALDLDHLARGQAAAVDLADVGHLLRGENEFLIVLFSMVYRVILRRDGGYLRD